MATSTAGIDVDALRMQIHTPDSWARAVAVAALDQAASADSFGHSPVEIDAEVTVKRRQGATDSPADSVILGICLTIHGQTYCYGLSGGPASLTDRTKTDPSTP